MTTLIHDARRAAILEAASELFSSQGYHKTTMPEIARSAGSSVGLIYYHFTSKADILVGIVEEFHAFGLEVFARSHTIADPLERLDVAVRDLYLGVDRFSKLFVILYKDLSALNHEERQRIYDLEEETVNRVVTLIEEGQQAGQFAANLPNVPLLAANIVGLGNLWALKKTWYFASRVTLDEYISTQLQYLHLLLAGDTVVPHQ